MNPTAFQSPSDPEHAVRIRARLYTRENITIFIMLLHHFGCRVIHLVGKEFTKKGSSKFRTPAGAINLTVAGFKTFFLTLKFARTEKYKVTLSCLGET
jgi:hypothetical protein